MTTSNPVGDRPGDAFELAWREERRRLIGLARQIVGDPDLAEDIVQEAYARLATRDDVLSAGAWLSSVTSRLCLDHLKSAATRHERPAESTAIASAAPAVPDPADRVTLDDTVRAALFAVLDRLTPDERVGFILHDVFGLKFDEIAEVTGGTSATVRKQASRARRRLAESPPMMDVSARHCAESEITRRFMVACHGGDLDGLIGVLVPEAWGRATFVSGAPPQSNRGAADVARNLLLFLPGATLIGQQRTVHAFNGIQWFATITLDIDERGVRSIEAVVDPRGAI